MPAAHIAFFVALAAEILIVGLITVIWPAKAAEGAVPVAIIVCGLAGPFFPGPWYRVGLLGGILGLLDAGVLIILSRILDVPEKFGIAQRIVLSIVFAAATALGTWLWTEFERRRGKL